MSKVSEAYEHLLGRFIAWANTQPDIRAAVILGSRARRDTPADDWSDLDLVIFANDPARLFAQDGWLEQMGEPWMDFFESTATGDSTERRVLFADGLDVDFIPVPADLMRQLAAGELPGVVGTIIQRGMRVVLDKDGALQRLPAQPSERPAATPPSAEAFGNLVNDFWYHTVWATKKLRRGELWMALLSCDSYLKRLLREMIEWHTGALHGWGRDTWHQGRFLERWADPRAVAALSGAFAHYDADDVARAILATMDIFRMLATETAERLAYPYPAEAEQKVTELVRQLLDARR